ncbi:MAG: FliM/FliN family flagellar motor switch protein [Candidatus Cloacimonetes bacterium]|nr:FliM/FliN family flagellar motor switch protein [Candidatus Cloacimonadota bacterium]
MKKILTQEEIDALLTEAKEKTTKETIIKPGERIIHKKKNVRRYDFKHPEILYKAQFRILKFIHDIFAKSFGANLSSTLRTIVDLESLSVDQVRYNEYMSAFDESTCLYTITSHLMGDALIEINSRFIQLIVDRMFGGSGEGPFFERPITTIEQKAIRKIVFQLIDRLNDSWRNIVNLEYKFRNFETSPQLVQLTHPNEITILHIFGLEFAGTKYTMNICYPYYAMESIIKGISTQKIRVKTVSRKEKSVIQSNILNTKIPFIARLYPINVTIRDVNDLKIEDVIVSNHSVNQDLPIYIGEYPKFFGRLIKKGKKDAIILTKFYGEGVY